ncbi:MAG: hypothetical protein U0359_25515 [Byssovorax sp.]
MPPRPPRFASAGTALVAALTLPACGASAPPPPTTPINIIEWATGPEHLALTPGSSGTAILVLSANPSAGTAPPAAPKCYLMTTILPGPAADPRIFAVIGGKLHVFPSRNDDPVPLTGGNPSLTLTRLLAFAKATPPLTLLVAARPTGAQGEQVWALTINGDAITASAEVTSKQAFANQESFFRQYNAPRCKPGGKECLVLSSDGESSFLDVESVRGDRPKTLRKLPGVTIDASWASSDGNQIYLLVPCPPSATPPPSKP